jgi:GAF domain-containing protein
MFSAKKIDSDDKLDSYQELGAQLEALLSGEDDVVANAANTSALLFQALPDINWVGFYFLRDNGELVLGPFQGKPACVRIALGRGVCGAAAQQRRSILVEDVNTFPGHIACDVASRSELVIPIIEGDSLFGVLDLDSPIPARFDLEDQIGMEKLAKIFVAASASTSK